MSVIEDSDICSQDVLQLNVIIQGLSYSRRQPRAMYAVGKGDESEYVSSGQCVIERIYVSASLLFSLFC